jgi:alkaline phosphatase D
VLQPGSSYWYRFIAGDGTSSPVGRIKTSLPPDSSEPIKIAWFSCQDFIVGNYATHRDLAARDDIDLAICVGDYIYEKAFFNGQVRSVPTTPDGQVRTLPEYRAQYECYHSDPNLRALRAAMPLVAIWDDHEVEDNYAGELPGGASEQGRKIPFPQRRAAAYQAWFESMPIIRDPAVPDRIYGSRRVGQVELFSIDDRQYRTNQPCSPHDDAIVLCTNPYAPDDPKATLLGLTQRQWLFDALSASTAPWKLILNQVMAMSLDLLPGVPLNTDSWDGYAHERALLCDHISQNNIKDVSFLTGDIHTFFAGSVTRTGRYKSYSIPGEHAGPPVATEFVGGSITSQGIADRVSTKESDKNAAARVIDPVIRGANPHMRFANSAYKGYGILEATPSGLNVEYRAVRDPRNSASEVFSLAKFRVDRGSTVVQLVAKGPVAPASGPPPSLAAMTAELRAFGAGH